MSLSYFKEENIIQSIETLSNGNFFPLFKLALSSLYNPRELLNKPEFIINMIKNFSKHEDRMSFIELLIESRINLLQEHIETDDVILNSFNRYWNNEIPNSSPLLFYIIPYLQDLQLSKILDEHSLYDLLYHKDSKHYAECLVTKLFDKVFPESLIALKKEYSIICSVDLLKDINPPSKNSDNNVEPKTLNDLFLEKTFDHPELLFPYSKISYTNMESLCDIWFNHHLNGQDKDINYNILNKFIDNVFDTLEIEAKESVVAHTLNNTNTLSLCNRAINKMGYNSINEYKPTKIPLWIYSGSYKDPLVYSKLIKKGIDIFDYYPPSNTVFLSCVLSQSSWGGIEKKLNEKNIDFKSTFKKMFEEKIDCDNKKYTNFSLLCVSHESSFDELINFKPEKLSLISKKFSPENYNKLSAEKKLLLLNPIIEKTFLANVYVSNLSFNKYTAERINNFNLLISKSYCHNESIYLIDEHLDLLSKNVKLDCDYRPQYFQIANQLFDFWGSSRIQENSGILKTYIKIIDYIATDKNLDWKSLHDFLKNPSLDKKKAEFYEGSKNIFSYLEKVSLYHTLESPTPLEKRKIKI